MGWLTALGVLILLASIPLGADVCYDESGPQVKLVLGPVKLTLYPRPKKKKKPEPKKEKQEPKQEKKQPAQSAPKKAAEPAEEPKRAAV